MISRLYRPKQSSLYDLSMQLQSERVWDRRLAARLQSGGEEDCDLSEICRESQQKLMGRLGATQH
ncbi:hypothetical protein L195_g056873 [Trifolium pratense]|uniref:Uncharacterized protein n=1 Tax=Trifolium pratense TaxID=57577 RepID=A0A2K3KTW1_TRIPR|nr:hypothetical protein L195_g056873 [Trifolium pratense]